MCYKTTAATWRITCLVLLSLCLSVSAKAQSNPLGIFDQQADIGEPALKGSVMYNQTEQTYLLSGAGKNMWFNHDQFRFAWKKIKGDFMIKATIRFIGKGTDAHRKIGIIARDQLTPDSRHINACVHGSTLTSLQYREATGDSTREIPVSSFHPTEIELERSGNVFTFSAASAGEMYKSVRKEIALNEEVYAGIYICSHAEDVLEQAQFSNVRIIIPPSRDFRAYRDYLGSHLEVMDIATGHRRILHSAPNSLQAPNWTPDNKYLIYNEDGLLRRYELSTGKISVLNTGFARENNNDHVLSFDGKQMAISNHTGPGHTSVVYTLPISGSDKPEQITSEKDGHSYLHGWSPDGSKLLFTGQRGKEWNIWSVDIATKKQTRLTEDPLLDDGPEYTPDGKYIYFNSVRTGTMKLWRMKPDGSEQEQVTFDEYNDWFPHISPDGKWIVFISFPKEIDPSSHPFYQKVYLRLMPAGGGVPRTIAYVYGGQGTINVPSWSPDSKKIAFVSNTKL